MTYFVCLATLLTACGVNSRGHVRCADGDHIAPIPHQVCTVDHDLDLAALTGATSAESLQDDRPTLALDCQQDFSRCLVLADPPPPQDCPPRLVLRSLVAQQVRLQV